MDYRKERNFIVAYDENEKLRGKWNISTNEYIGVRGNPVKSMPDAFRFRDEMPDYIQSVFEAMTNNTSRWNPYDDSIGQRLEQIISLQLKVNTYYGTWDFLRIDKTPLTKELITFLHNEYDGIYSDTAIKNFNFYKKHQAFLNKCGEHKEWATEVLRDERIKQVPKAFVEDMILCGIREKVFHTQAAYSFVSMLRDWNKMVSEMGDELEAKCNILTNYTILQYLHKEYKEAHYDELLLQHNNCPWLYYENDEYTVFPLLTRNEFHAEATSQNNCVERMYMEYVARGDTHVVVVRKKNQPNKSYITCEVSNQGKIRQYLYSHNRTVTNGKDYAFRNEYANYLSSLPLNK